MATLVDAFLVVDAPRVEEYEVNDLVGELRGRHGGGWEGRDTT